MRLKPDQLSRHLQGPLRPIYLLSGDEPLQMEESLDALRRAAREQGYTERSVLHVEPGFDWGSLKAFSCTLSLFAERRVLDLRIPTGKPGAEGTKAISELAEAGVVDLLVLISTARLDANQQKSRWVKAIEGAGVFVQIWPVDAPRLPAWVRRRAKTRGIELTEDAASILAERGEGNMLACSQEIDKLALLYPGERLEPETLLSAVADSARYDVFDLVDAAVGGEPARCVRTLKGLRAEGVEPPLVAWALGRELRALEKMAHGRTESESPAAVAARMRIPPRRRDRVVKALGRHGVGTLRGLLRRLAAVERTVKGVDAGDPWAGLMELSLALARGRGAERSAGAWG